MAMGQGINPYFETPKYRAYYKKLTGAPKKLAVWFAPTAECSEESGKALSSSPGPINDYVSNDPKSSAKKHP